MTHRHVATFLFLLVVLSGCRPDPGTPATAAADNTAQRAAAASRASSTSTAQVPPDAAVEDPESDLEVAARRRDALALADTLAHQGDAQALAVAALLRADGLLVETEADAASSADRYPEHDKRVLDWLDDAERQSPDDVVALVVALYIERNDASRRQALIARWRALEPDNLVPILFAPGPEATLFDASSAASRYDSHYDDFLRAVYANLSRPSARALVSRMAARDGLSPEELIAGFSQYDWRDAISPSFNRITEPCGRRPLADVRRLQCRSLADILLRRSDAVVVQSIGADLAKTFAATSAEGRQIEQAQRTLRWVMACASASFDRDPKTYMKRYARIVTTSESFTESSMLRQLALEAGYPPEPPPGWQPDQAP